MNKMSICLQSLIIALFALAAANNFCMNKKEGTDYQNVSSDTENYENDSLLNWNPHQNPSSSKKLDNLEQSDSWKNASTLFGQAGDDWKNASEVFSKHEDLDPKIRQEVIDKSKIEMCIEFKTKLDQLAIKQKENIGRPSAFIYALAYALPYISVLGGLVAGVGGLLLNGTNNKNSIEIALLATGCSLGGVALTNKLCGLFTSKVRNYNRKIKAIDQEIKVLTPLYNNILARKKLFSEE